MGDERDRSAHDVAESIQAARAAVAAAEARLAALCVEYADVRTAEDEADRAPAVAGRPAPGEFVPDELSVLLGEQAWDVRLLLARSRRVRSQLPTVWEAAERGELSGERVRLIDRAARLATEPSTVAVLEERAVEAAMSRTPKQLKSWLDRLLAELEPEAYHRRHERAYADRRVTTSTSATGMGYVTGEVSSADAAAIDLRLASLARSLGAADPRTVQQRRADLFADLLLGHQVTSGDVRPDALEMEMIDPDTGECLGTRLVPLEEDAAAPATTAAAPATDGGPEVKLGVVVSLSTLLGLDDRPGELGDRSGCVPVDIIRRIAGQPGTIFYRLLTDDVGHLLDVTELGRFPSDGLADAVRFRVGSCSFPTCSVPAALCDLDHHEPYPAGPTRAANLDPLCRRHHRGKTFAGLASRREDDAICWTLPTSSTYRCLDELLPVPPGPAEEPDDPLDLPEVGELLDIVDAAA